MPKGVYKRIKNNKKSKSFLKNWYSSMIRNNSWKKAWKTRRKNKKDKNTNNAKKGWETRKKLGKIEPWNKNLTKEKNKIVALIGKKVRKFLLHKTYEEIHGKEKAKKLKTKLREIKINKYKKDGVFLFTGRHEKQLLDEIEQKENIKIDRNFTIIGYKPDGYCHETNTIYEVYEKYHKKQVKHDLRRQKEIEKELKCKFIIIEDY